IMCLSSSVSKSTRGLYMGVCLLLPFICSGRYLRDTRVSRLSQFEQWNHHLSVH
ncbi:hypothetical protein NDU88_003663, partial [Pleurodeles waltl]